MARRFELDLHEALELVMQDGSDDEVDLGYDDRDGEDEDDFTPVQVADLEVEEEFDLDRSTSAAVDTQLDLDPDPEPGSELPDEVDEDSDDDIVPPTPPQQSTSRSSPGPSTSHQSPLSPDLFDDQEPEPVEGAEAEVPDPADQPPDDPNLDLDSDLSPDDDQDRLLFDEPLEWTRDLDNYPISPPFTGPSGFQIDHPPNATALWFYQLFMTGALIKKMKTETNRYAAAACRQALRRNPNLSRRSFFRAWKTVTESDIWKFLAVCIHMGLVHKPRINDYWAKNRIISSTFASTLMVRDRFKMILAFFHLNDNTNYVPAGNPRHDPLFKLRPLVDTLLARFKAVYIPSEKICIDEALCPWRGRVGFRVYIKNKPVKWGIKLYELCESVSGYVFNFEVYCRKPNLSNSPGDVVKRLLAPLSNQGRILFMDNYYMCPNLAFDLLLENTNSVGTTRANRVGMPKELVEGPFRPGQMDYRRRGQVLCVRWKDKRDVNMLTATHLPTMKEVVTRAERKQKPDCNVDYTKHMAGVDHSDQMIAYAPLHRKTVKWWKRLSFHLITLCMVQAHCLYNKHMKDTGKSIVSLVDFAISVAKEISEQQNVVLDRAVADRAQSADRLVGRHFLEAVRNDEGKKKQRGCHVCYQRSIRQNIPLARRRNYRKMTQWQCKTCKIALCIEPCMELYHTKKDYDV